MSGPLLPGPAADEAPLAPGLLVQQARRLGRYGWALLTPVASLTFAALTNAVTSRALGPEQFGAFSIAVTSATLLGIAMGFGMPSTMVRYAGRYAPEDAAGRAGSVRTAWRLVAWAVVACALAALAVLRWRPPAIDAWVPGATGIWIIVAALGVVLTEMAAAGAQLGFRFGSYFRTMVTSLALRLAGIVIAILVAGPRLVNATAGFAIGYASAGLLNALAASRHAGRSPRTAPVNERTAMLRFGAPVMLSSLLVAAISAVDTLTVAATLDATRTGWYAAAVRLAIVQLVLIQGISTLALPFATEAARRGDLGRYARRVLSLGALAGVAVTAVMVVAAPLAVSLVYGDRYEASVRAYQVYALGIVINFPGNPLSQILYARNRPGVLTAVHVAQLAALLLALPFAARAHGIVGAAACWAIVNTACMAVVVAMSLREARRAEPA